MLVLLQVDVLANLLSFVGQLAYHPDESLVHPFHFPFALGAILSHF